MARARLDVLVDVKGDEKLDGVERELDEIGDSLDEIEGKSARAFKFDDLNQVGSRLSSLGGNISGVGAALTAGVTLPITAAGAASIKAASDFESSFAGVRKTIEEADLAAAGLTFDDLAESFRGLAKEVPISVNELNRIGEAAGQLGIPAARIVEFTDIMARLGVTTNLSADEAATALSRFANISGGVASTNFESLGNVVVGLGNNFATTEAEIVEFGLRLAGSGNQIGLSQEQILAFGAALSSVGINAEAGGTAISRVFVDIAQSVETGGDKLALFADVAGQTVEQFRHSFQRDAAGAVISFIQGLSTVEERGGSVFEVLESLELQNVRVRDALLRSAGAGDLLTDALAKAQGEMSGGNALAEEAAKRFETFESKARLLFNQLQDVAITVGGPLLDALSSTIDAAEPLINGMADLAQRFADAPKFIQLTVIGLGGLAAAIGPILVALGGLVASIGTLASAMGSLGISATALTGTMGALVTTVGSVLLPVLAAAATAIAAFKLTDMILEATGLRNALDDLARSILGVQESLPPTTQQTGAMARASEIAGREITNWKEATSILNQEILKQQQASVEAGEASLGVADANESAAESTDEASEAARELAERLRQIELEKRRKEMEKYLQAVNKLAEGLGGAGLAKDIDLATAAISSLGGASNVTRAGLDSLAPLIEKMRRDSVALPPPLREIAVALDRIALSEGLSVVAEDMESASLFTQNYLGEVEGLQDVLDGFPPSTEAVEAGLTDAFGPNGQAKVGGLEQRTITLQGAMDGVNDVLSEARGLMNLFGVEGDSAFGKIIAGASKAFDTFNSLLGIVDRVTGLLGGLGGAGGGLAGLFGGGGGGGIGGIAGALGGLFGGGGIVPGVGAGGIGASLGGVGAGAGAAGGGAGIGGLLAGLATNPFTLIGAGGLGAFLGLKAIFGKEANIAETVERDLGPQLSEGLENALAQLAEQRGDLSSTAQLAVGPIFREAFAAGDVAATADRLAEEIGDVFSAIEQGIVSKPEAIIALEDAIPLLIQRFSELGPAGEEQLNRIVSAAESFGIEFEGLDEIAAQVNRDVEGIGDGFEQLPSTASEAVNQIGATFEDGSQKITEGLTPVTDKISTEIRDAGQTTSDAINDSFAQTNDSIRSGLDEVAGVYAAKIAPSALLAADATLSIADAAREAARAARDIVFPAGGDAGNIPSFQHGGFVPETPPFGRIVRVAEPGTGGEFITPRRGGQGQGTTIHMGGISVTVTGGANDAGVRALVDALEKNQSDQAERLKKILRQ